MFFADFPFFGNMKPNFKRFTTQRKSIDLAKRTIDFVMSTDDVDYCNEMLTKEGWEFDRDTIPMTVDHDYRAEKAIAVVVPELTAEGLIGHATFASTEFAKEIFTLYAEGILTDVSVGYMTLEAEYKEKEGTLVWTITRKLLKELSACLMGMNPAAMVKAVEDGMLSKKSVMEIQKMQEEELLLADSKKVVSLLTEWHEPIKLYRKLLKLQRKTLNLPVNEDELASIAEVSEAFETTVTPLLTTKELPAVTPQAPKTRTVTDKKVLSELVRSAVQK